MSRFETYSDLPGQATIAARPAPLYPALACLAGAAWPPLLLTLRQLDALLKDAAV